MPTPEPMTVAAALADLETLGVSAIITVVATISLAGLLYKRFRR